MDPLRSATRRSRSRSGSRRSGNTDGLAPPHGTPSPPATAGAQLMPEAHDRPTEPFKLRLRRYDPESGGAPYWDEHTIELEPHRSVLEAVLQAKDRFDGSIGIRCSCRQAICGSCGIRVNGEPA